MSIGIWQVVLVLLIVLILFGAGKLPKMMADVAEGVKNFRTTIREVDAEEKTALTSDANRPVDAEEKTALTSDANRPVVTGVALKRDRSS